MVILALDSGIERTGYAVFKKDTEQESLLTYGCMMTSKKETLQKRLYSLQQQIEELFHQYSPNHIVMEQLFFNVNKKTAIMVAQAQGAVLSMAGEHDIPVDFLSPLTIKQSLTGYGRADKKSVEKMVLLSLGMETAPKLDDTVDAIACGLTFCTMLKFQALTV